MIINYKLKLNRIKILILQTKSKDTGVGKFI